MISTILVPIGRWKRKFAVLPVYRDEQPEVINGVKHTKRTKIWLEHYWEMQITNSRREITCVLQTNDQRFAEFVVEVNAMLNFKYDVSEFTMTDATMDIVRRLFDKGLTHVQVLESMSNSTLSGICINLVEAYGPINMKCNKGQVSGASTDMNLVLVESAIHRWIATTFPVTAFSGRTLVQQVRDSAPTSIGPATLKTCMIAFNDMWIANEIKATMNDDGIWIDYLDQTYHIEVKENND